MNYTERERAKNSKSKFRSYVHTLISAECSEGPEVGKGEYHVDRDSVLFH